MSIFRNKIISLRSLFAVALHILFGALILLCIQARLSKAVPLQGPLRYLSSATRMIHDRSMRPDQIERQADDQDEHHLYREPYPELVLALSPMPMAQTVS